MKYLYAAVALIGIGLYWFQQTPEPEMRLGAITASSTTITATGYRTLIVSANACETSIAAWGAGGGGAIGSTNQGGAGGGGGAFASSTITTTPGDTLRIYIAPSTATEVNGATTTASTTAPTLIVAASGGTAATAAAVVLGGRGSVGDVTKNGGNGGAATTGTGDESGGGGGAGGPHGVGGNGGSCDGSTTVGCGGGASNSGSNGTDNTVTAGTAVAGTSGANGGVGDDGTTPDAVGANAVYGGGGGGGADDGRQGRAGGTPGGGGGGSEITGAGGAAGQIIITEFINDVGCGSAPTVTTQSVSSVGATTATANGNITDTGGQGPTVRGFAWGTSATMVGDTATTTDTVGQPFGTGAFTGSLTGLVGNTTYYTRAYATNPVGTGLGSVSASFLTLPGTPGNPSFTNVRYTTMTVSWTAPTGGVDTYKLERCITSTDTCTLTTGIAGTSQDLTLLLDGTSYDFAVRATNATGDGAWSATTTQATVKLPHILNPSGSVKIRSGKVILK